MTVGESPEEIFRAFCSARDLHEVLDLFQQLCLGLRVDPTDFRNLYANIKSKLGSAEARVLWALLDKRAKQDVYGKNKACSGAKMLIIGAGPCGLRMAIEGALLGARAVVVEMRDYLSRNNVLHLWPFVIHDLKAIGAKVFYPKFCTGSLNHISIRCAQCILLKVALLLGVEVHTPVAFVDLREPCEDKAGQAHGWRAELSPVVPSLVDIEFDIVVGADGKRNMLKGFDRKCFRGKQALAITANFVNWRTRADNQVEEIGGIFRVFKPKFFEHLQTRANIDLENFVYYRNDTHYFVMTAKRQSLLDKGVLKEHFPDSKRLLHSSNIDQERLRAFAMEVAALSTKNKIPVLEFARNHHGEEDIAIFDFTAMYQANHSCRSIERQGKRVLMCIVGDSLIEPFWPTGSGCARGFLGVFDAAWLIRAWCDGDRTPLTVIAEREAIFTELSQATPGTLKPKVEQYTIDPRTRYSHLSVDLVKPEQVRHLYDSDDIVESPAPTTIRRFTEAEIGTHRHGTSMDSSMMLAWYQGKLAPYRDRVTLTDLMESWRDGIAFCGLVHRYRPDLIDLSEVRPDDAVSNLETAFEVILTEWGLVPLLSAEDLAFGDRPDDLAMITYLTQIREALELEPDTRSGNLPGRLSSRPLSGRRPSAVSLLTRSSTVLETCKRHLQTVHTEPTSEEDQRMACTGKAAKLIGAFEANTNRHRPHRKSSVKQTTGTEAPPGDISVAAAEGLSSITDLISSISQDYGHDSAQADRSGTYPVEAQTESQDRPDDKTDGPRSARSGQTCCICGKLMYILERDSLQGYFFHRSCCRCHTCKCTLRIDSLVILPGNEDDVRFFCFAHAQSTEEWKTAFMSTAKKPCISDNWRVRQESSGSVGERSMGQVDQPEPEVDNGPSEVTEMPSAAHVRWVALDTPDTSTPTSTEDTTPAQTPLQEDSGDANGCRDPIPTTDSPSSSDTQGSSSDEDKNRPDGEFTEEGALAAEAVFHNKTNDVASEAGADETKPVVKRRHPDGIRKRRPPTVYRQSVSLHMLLADEIQSGLEVVDQEQEQLEIRGRQVEEELRGRIEVSPPTSPENEDLLDEWLHVLHRKKHVRNKEFKLLLKKKLFELHDRRKSLQRARLESKDQEALQQEFEQLERDTEEVEQGLAELTSHVRQLRSFLGEFGDSAI